MFVSLLGRLCHPHASQNALMVPLRKIEMIERRVYDEGTHLEIRVRMGSGPRYIFVTDANEQTRLLQHFLTVGERPVFFPVPAWGSKTHRRRRK